MDYAIWSVIQQRVYETRVHDIDELRQRLLHVWCSLELQPGLLPRPSHSLGRELGSKQLACVGRRLLTTLAYNARLLRHSIIMT